MSTARATALLWCGVVAGPLFLLVSSVQAFTREGFDPVRHPFSSLSLGEYGWIQIGTFVVSGLLFVGAAVGMRRTLAGEAGGTWGPALFFVLGAGLVGGGVFVVDPALGYPPGAPAGRPETLSFHGMMHGVVFGVATLAWVGACLVVARRFASEGQRGWALSSVATGVILVVPLAFFGVDAGVPLLYTATTLGFAWTTAVMTSLLRAADQLGSGSLGLRRTRRPGGAG